MGAVYALQFVLMVGTPLVLLWLVRRRWTVPLYVFGIGAGTFVLSQLVHVPLNMGLTAIFKHGLLPPPPASIKNLFNAVVLGLSAGLCEEIARWLTMRYWLRKRQSGPDAVAFGVGHGGIEAMLLGILTAVNLVVLLNIERFNLTEMGVPAEQLGAVTDAVNKVRNAPVYLPLLAAVERLFALALHLCASALVMLAVVRKQPRWLVLAIGWHAFIDAVAVWTVKSYGVVATELALVPLALVSLILLRAAYRRLPAAEPNRDAPDSMPSSQPNAPIRLLSVRKTFGSDVVALDNASFTIVAGTRTCLLGPNGAGKTTTIRLITGGLRPSSGQAYLFGRSARDSTFLASKRRVGIVPQQPGMYRDITVRQYLELGQALYQTGNVATTIDEMQLTSFADRNLAELSGGMQRRVALAAALLPAPELLILDEPSAGLDPVASRQLTRHLSQVTRGRTVLLCTHNLAEAEALCDSVVILLDGRVIMHDSIAELRLQLTPTVTLRAAQGPVALCRALAAKDLPASVEGEDVLFPMQDAPNRTPELLRALLADGLDVQQCRIEEASLEDIFLAAVEANRGKPTAAIRAPAAATGRATESEP